MKRLAVWIFAALALGVAVGLLFTRWPQAATTYIAPFGTIFLNLLKFQMCIRDRIRRPFIS